MDEEPMLLLVIDEGGIPVFSNSFTENLSFEDESISNFLTALNIFSQKLFSDGLDRAKFGDNMLIMDSIDSFSVCYLFKGQSYRAKQKLIQFADQVRNTSSIWQVFTNFQKTHREIVLGDDHPLKSLVTDIFLRSSLEIQTSLEIDDVKEISSQKSKIVEDLFYKSPDFINFLTKKLEKLDYIFIKSLDKSGAWATTYRIFHELTDETRLLKLYKVPVDESSKSVLVKQDKKLSQLELETVKNSRERGFTHGDLHEGKILISPENELKVIDPGFSIHDSDIEFIHSLFKRYFFSVNEMKLPKFQDLIEKNRIREILEVIRQIKESFQKKEFGKKGGIKKKYELVYKDLLEEYSRVEKSKCRVAVAQIGLSQTDNIIREFFKLGAPGVLRLREEKVDLIRAKVKNMVEDAFEKEINILLFPELLIDLNYAQISEDIEMFAKKYEMYIIPGSYLNQKTLQNLCVVYGPDGILWEQRKHIPAIITLNGKKVKEGIDMGSFPRKTIVCNTEYGRIAIAICRDFLDMDLRVELKNFEPPVDILLNPAFTPVMADFWATHFDARRSIYAYCFFVNVAHFGESIIYTPEKERVERMIPPKKEGLIFKDLDIFKLRENRKKWEKVNGKKFIQSVR
ncbi:MAG: nitrilase-related carbon-nitrogen hydrolase, partial [Promethearchaeota archaeon]